MKKISSILLIIISLAGVFLIGWRTFFTVTEGILADLPPLPQNLSAEILPPEISLTEPLPIFMYHHVKDYPSGKTKENTRIIVSPANFQSQINWLVTNGFETVDFSYLENPVKLSKKPIILTFDDGYQDAYTQVFPILKKYNLTATFYLVIGDIGKSGSLTKNQILEMQQAGMKFGSHSLTHPDLTKISRKQAQEQIYGSKKLLEQQIRTEVKDFCYPGGTFNHDIENIVINSGYTTATIIGNEINTEKINPFELKRLDIINDTNFENLTILKY